MGFRKTDESWGGILRYIAPYIIFMIITTVHSIVKLRDHLIRFSIGKIKNRSTLFPQIGRNEAELDFIGLVKYLFNYGFFKFGKEITLIALVSTIVHRRDLLSITYILWLILLLSLPRRHCARIWVVFQYYFVISLLVQYLFEIHTPPHLCYHDSSTERMIETAPTITSHNTYMSSIKTILMLDFLVLFFISCQKKAFNKEMSKIKSIPYPGGDNLNIVHIIAKLGHVYFRNPTHDFCSFVRNYSDVLKTIIFCSFLWITLAIVFMGGICGMDMLSLGYLIFALVFLIRGSEVYLQNIYYILWMWNSLIAFNVFNIVIKSSIIVFGNLLLVKHKQDYQSLFAVMYYDRIVQSEIDRNLNINVSYHYGPDSLIFKNTLVWHAIIFAFIIFQKRIFCSYYFCHIIMDTKANTVLASR